jgi:hypothetical protein
MKFHWYFSVWWFDMPMHFFGGVFIGLIALAFQPKKPIINCIISVLIIGVLWEIFESEVNFFTLSPQNPLLDTFSDLAFDLAGGLSASLYFLYNKNTVNGQQ